MYRVLLIITLVSAVIFLLTLGIGYLSKDERWNIAARVFFHTLMLGVFGMVLGLVL